MSLERNAHVRIIGTASPWLGSLFATMRQAERLALQAEQPVTMNTDGTVRPARRSDHVWGCAVDLPPGIGRRLWTPWPVLQTRATRRGERRRVALLLRQQTRARRTEAAIRRQHAAITRGDAWHRGGGDLPSFSPTSGDRP